MKTYIKILVITSLIMAGFATWAQAPQKFNYQAVARTASGPVANATIGVQFSIHDGTAAGTVVYAETHSGVATGASGLFTAAIGGGTPTTGLFTDVVWGAGDKFLEIAIDTNNSGTYASMGTVQLLSVPFALHAASSGDWAATGSNISNANSGNVGIGTTSIPSESKLVIGAVDNFDEGGQIQLDPSNPLGSAFYIDNYSSIFRVMEGDVQGSDITLLSIAQGDVGIGIGNNLPAARLEIGGGAIQVNENAGASTDVKKKVFGNSMPLAYGYIDYVSGTTVNLTADYGIESVSKTGVGQYLLTLSTNWSGTPVPVFTGIGAGVVVTWTPYGTTSNTNIIAVNIRSLANTAIDADFTCVVFGTPQ